MAKKTSTPKQLKTKSTPPITKNRKPFFSVTNHTSPKSKSSDTSIYFEDNEDRDVPTPPIKNLETQKVEALLMLSGIEYPSEFKYRDRQVGEICEFVCQIENKTKRGCRFLMVTGSPGLGKTLTITSVLKKAECKVIYLNANMTRSLRDIQESIYEELIGKRPNRQLTTHHIIRELIASNCTEPVIIYIQEIEAALNCSPNDHTHQFLALFSKRELNLGLIGVSNSIDALQKYNSKVHFSLYQIKNLVFTPYGQDEIGWIIRDKVVQIKQKYGIEFDFDEKLLKFAAKKLENLTKGDLRMVNEFLKELISTTMTEEEANCKGQEESKLQFKYCIQIKMIQKIFQKMQNSKQDLIQSLPFSQKLLLLGIHTIISDEELLYITEDRIFHGMKKACELICLDYVCSKVKEWMRELQNYSLVKVEERKDRQARITLLVNSEEMKDCIPDKEKYIRCFLPKQKTNN